MDALQVEVVGRDVGQHARLVQFVADAAQDDAAAGGLEDGHVQVAPGEDLVGAAGSRPVARVDHPLVDQHAVRGRRPDAPAGQQQDVGDEPGHGALAVRPRDRHDRDPAIGVADPGRRRGPGRGDPLGPARDEALLGAGQPGGPRRRHVALGQGDGGLGQGQRALRPDPREGHDPVARIGRAMDAQAAAPLVVLEPEPPDPAGDGGHPVGPVARRDRRPEMDQRMSTGVALAVPRPATADGDLELDHRLEPIDVGTFEQTGLDQAHGPGRIASARGLDFAT